LGVLTKKFPDKFMGMICQFFCHCEINNPIINYCTLTFGCFLWEISYCYAIKWFINESWCKFELICLENGERNLLFCKSRTLTHLSENPIATELLIQISEEKNFSQCRIVGLKIHKLLCIYSFSLNYSNLSINFTVYEKRLNESFFFSICRKFHKKK